MQPDIQVLDSQYVADTYRRFPVVLKHGKGSLVYDENEKEYIDLSSGIAHCNTPPTFTIPNRVPYLLPCSAKKPA